MAMYCLVWQRSTRASVGAARLPCERRSDNVWGHAWPDCRTAARPHAPPAANQAPASHGAGGIPGPHFAGRLGGVRRPLDHSRASPRRVGGVRRRAGAKRQARRRPGAEHRHTSAGQAGRDDGHRLSSGRQPRRRRPVAVRKSGQRRRDSSRVSPMCSGAAETCATTS